MACKNNIYYEKKKKSDENDTYIYTFWGGGVSFCQRPVYELTAHQFLV